LEEHGLSVNSRPTTASIFTLLQALSFVPQRAQIDDQGRSQEFGTGGGTKEGAWGRKSPSEVQGQSPGVVWGRSPQKPEANAYFQLRWGHVAGVLLFYYFVRHIS